MNRAIEGDTVVVRLLPKAEWRRAGPKGERLADQGSKEEDELAVESKGDSKVEVFAAEFGAEDEVALDPRGEAPGERGGGGGGARACGVVVGVVKRNWRPYVCVLDPESAMGSQYLVEPLDTRVPKAGCPTAPRTAGRLAAAPTTPPPRSTPGAAPRRAAYLPPIHLLAPPR